MPVHCVIDINPAKQNEFLAATAIQVVAAEEAFRQPPAGSEIIVMNENYLAEIRQMTAERFQCVTLDS